MNRTASKIGVLLVALLIVAGGVTGCGGGNQGSKSSGAITMPKKFKVAPGADPSVPAEMGGAGFEKIAKDSGWSDGGTLAKGDLDLLGDPNAKKGGELRMLIGDFPSTFRLMGKDANTATTSAVTGLVYESMIGINPLTMQFLPSLASHWKVDPKDSQTYWFRINPNARFSDGHPVTTDDIIATWKLGLDSTILDPFQNTFEREFDMPVAHSKYLLSVHSKQNNWKNMLYFGGVSVYPAHVIGNMSGTDFLKKFQTDMPPGSGPYIMLPSGLKRQQSITMTRLADWWQKDDALNQGQANFDRIKFTFVEDDNLQYNKFRNGDADVYVVGRSQWWKQKFDFDEVRRGLIVKSKIWNDNPNGLAGIAFNERKPPFNDPRVRLAFILLINREEIIRKVLLNERMIMDSYFPGSPYANPRNVKYRYNPSEAARLLAEAGYTSRNADGVLMKNGVPFEVEMPITQGSEVILTPIQQMVRAGGIKIDFRNVDPTQYYKLMEERNFALIQSGYTGIIYPNPENQWSSRLADLPNNNNITGFKNARVDEIIKQEKVTYDLSKRIALLQELDSILNRDNPYALFWYSPFQRVASWAYIRQPKYGLGRFSDTRSIPTLWWYDPDVKKDVDEAKKDKSKKLPVPPVDNKFWPEWDKQHANGGLAVQ